jgi:hypothetical protein
MSDGAHKQSVFSICLNTFYGVLLALCFIMGTYDIFLQASSKELFAYKEKNGDVTIRSYVQGYICGAIALSPDRHKIFDPAVQLDYTNRAISPLKTDKYIFSQYMPYLFTLMAPFATLDIRTSFYLWTVFAGAGCAAGLWLLMQDDKRFTTMGRVLFLIGCAASLPYMINVYYGGLSPLIVGLLCVYYWGWLRGHDVVAGACIALSTLKPQYAVFAALPCLAHKRFKLIAAAAVSELLLLIIAGLNVGWENVINYPQILLKADTSAEYLGVFPEKMVSLRGPLSALLPKEIANPVCLAAMVIAIVLLLWLWTKTDGKKPDEAAWAMAITMLAVMIVSPHTHIYDCIYLVLPAVLTLNSTSLTANLFTRPPQLRLWSYMILLYPLFSWCLFLALRNIGNWSSYWALIYNCLLIILAIKQWCFIKDKNSHPAELIAG